MTTQRLTCAGFLLRAFLALPRVDTEPARLYPVGVVFQGDPYAAPLGEIPVLDRDPAWRDGPLPA